jgi:hypothetical protein
MSINFKEALTLTKAIGAVYAHRNDEMKLLDQIIFGNSELDSLINKLTKDVITGFNNVVNVLDEAELLKLWSPINQTLNTIGQDLTSYKNAMSTVTKDANGHFTIEFESSVIHYKDWCLGYTGSDGVVHRSRLDDMQKWFSSHTLYNHKEASLVGIFSSFGPIEAVGSDAIDVWLKICQKAQVYTNRSLLGNIGYNTLFNSVMEFMDCINMLVKLAYYVHDSALLLLNNILLKEPNGVKCDKLSVKPAIDAHFGAYNQTGSIWNNFATVLDSLNTGNPGNQYKTAAFTPALCCTTPPGYSHFERFRPNPSSFYAQPLSINGVYTNAFFSAIQISNIQVTNSKDENYESCCFALSGTVVQIGADMELSVVDQQWPSTSFYQDPSKWAHFYEHIYHNKIEIYYLNHGVTLGTFNDAYPPIPVHANKNHIPVVTGFQFQPIQNGDEFNVMLCVQYGVLDVTDPKAPTVTIVDDTMVQPAWAGQSGIQEFFCIQPSGNFSSQSYESGFITNMALSQAGGPLGGDMCISAQMAPEFYKSDFYQPTNLHKIIS